MLHIRLRRVGKKKQPSYRLIVCEKSKDPFGDYLENLGTYNPRTEPSEINLKADRIKDWISKGAQCSDTVWNILVDQGVVTGEKRKSIQISTKRKGKLEKKASDKAVAEEAKKAAPASTDIAEDASTAKEEPEGDSAEPAPEPADQEEAKEPEPVQESSQDKPIEDAVAQGVAPEQAEGTAEAAGSASEQEEDKKREGADGALEEPKAD